MKCFECGQLCLTRYYLEEEPKFILKECQVCGWNSHPTIIPEAIE